MEKRNLFVSGKAVVAAVCGAFTAAFGWLGWLVVAWAACMALDWVSGSAAAASRGAWSSAAARAGIWHKAGMVVVVLVCALTDAVLAVAVANLPGLGLEVNGVVLPVGVCAAVYLTEYARNRRLVAAIEYTAETLSGIPSIIYGLVGQMFFCQFLGMKKSLIAGAMTLVIMNLPTIMRTTQESLKTVPQSYREGAFGLGAGKWRTIRTVVLPGCVDGVITGCILAVGRILGETAALLYTAGFAHTLYSTLGETLKSSGATLSVALYVYAKEQGEFDVAFAIAAILMVLALLINLAASLTGRYFKKRRSL